MWKWIEELCEKYQKDHEQPPENIFPDDEKLANENRLMNITFALSDYGRMRLLLELNELFKKEKVLQVSTKAYPER